MVDVWNGVEQSVINAGITNTFEHNLDKYLYISSDFLPIAAIYYHVSWKTDGQIKKF